MRNVILTCIANASLIAATSAIAQTTIPVNPAASTPPPVVQLKPTIQRDGRLKLSSAEARALQGKLVYSADSKKIGEVIRFVREPDGTVDEMHVGIGGLLGIGETIIRVTPSEFTLADGRIDLRMTAEQANARPIVK